MGDVAGEILIKSLQGYIQLYISPGTHGIYSQIVTPIFNPSQALNCFDKMFCNITANFCIPLVIL